MNLCQGSRVTAEVRLLQVREKRGQTFANLQTFLGACFGESPERRERAYRQSARLGMTPFFARKHVSSKSSTATGERSEF